MILWSDLISVISSKVLVSQGYFHGEGQNPFLSCVASCTWEETFPTTTMHNVPNTLQPHPLSQCKTSIPMQIPSWVCVMTYSSHPNFICWAYSPWKMNIHAAYNIKLEYKIVRHALQHFYMQIWNMWVALPTRVWVVEMANIYMYPWTYLNNLAALLVRAEDACNTGFSRARKFPWLFKIMSCWHTGSNPSKVVLCNMVCWHYPCSLNWEQLVGVQ